MKLLAAIVSCWLLMGCATSTPRNTENICEIFQEKRSWYKDAKKAAKKWDTDIALIMAFIRRESGFVARARPPRKKILWVIPGPRLSDAYGYAQVKDSTWAWYEKDEGGIFANRDNFGDAADFVGWYNKKSARSCKISTRDAYKLYLAYHEGHGGYNRGTYKKKKHVQRYAKEVAARTWRYKQQLKKCEKRLNKRGWFLF